MAVESPLAVVLGGTHAHAPLIDQLRARNFRVLLCDHLESPPAARNADEHVRVSTLAMDDVLALARERRATLVIATCVDRANVTAAYVAERLGLPAPYDFATAARIADKLAMKQALRDADVPTAAFTTVHRANENLSLPLDYPLVVKPIDTGGSKGVQRVASTEALRAAIAHAFSVTAADRVLVEPFLDGVEISADCLVHDGEPHVLLLRRKYVLSGASGEVLSNYASVGPATVSTIAQRRVHDAVRAIVSAFGLRTTPLLVQFMVAGDDVRVIELAPRIGGGTNHRQVLLRSGVDLIGAAIEAWLGRATAPHIALQPGYSATGHVYAQPGRFGGILHAEALLADGVVDSFYTHKSRGASIGATMATSDRVGSYIVRGDTAQALVSRTREVMRRLDVVDLDGRSILRRDIHLKEL